MNKNIKIFSISFFVICLTFITAKGQKRYPEDLWTVEEVKKMAEKYNLQDSVSATKNTMLLTFSKSEIDEYFKEVYKYRAETTEYKKFNEKTKFVRSIDDYYTLVESMRIVKNDVVKSIGGIEKYAMNKKNTKKYTWRIYRNSNGDLRFVRNDTPVNENEKKLGHRIDNLPPQKE